MRHVPRVFSTPAAPVAVTPPPPTQTLAPRVLPGVIRTGIKVTVSELAKQFPQESEAMLAKTVQVLAHISADSLTWSQAQNVGLGPQKEYGELVQRLLDATSEDVTRVAPQHLARLQTILENCAQDFDPQSTSFFKKARLPAFPSHRNEIDQLRHKLNTCMSELDGPIQRVSEIRDEFHELEFTLLANGLACTWLADNHNLETSVSQVLVDRALSLTKTAGLVRQQTMETQATAVNLDALRDRIQEGVLISLPTWLSKISGQPASNDTQRFILRDDLRQIILRLQN